jgi:hypothetical protein
MSWTRPSRRPDRFVRRCRLTFESLEDRRLLSTAPLSPPHLAPHAAQPAGDPGSSGNVAQNEPYDAIIGASATRAQYNVDGTGLTAAVIDTGVNYNHEALGGGFGPGHKVEAGYNLADNNPDPNATASQHGTAVAGLLASDDPAHPGVAPGANLVALRVIGQTGNGDFVTVANGLQWVLDHHAQYNITVVNLSIADGQNYAFDWFSNDGGIGQRMAGLIQQLNALGIPVVTAAGNSFDGQQGMGFPAIMPSTLSVTGTDESDHLLSDAQRLGTSVGGDSATDLAAPSDMTAPADGNSFAHVVGTSFAAPLVSGSVLLLQEIYEQRFHTLPTVDQLDQWLQSGADSIHDPVTGIDLSRLDVLKAAVLIPAAPGGSSGGSSGGSTSGGSGEGSGSGSGQSSSSSQTALFVNGVAQGSYTAGTTADPLQNAAALFGGPITFQTTQQWTSSNIPSPNNTTEIIYNGQSLGKVASDSTANPVRDYNAAFNVPGTFNQVQIWTDTNYDSGGGGAGPAGIVTSQAGTNGVTVGSPHPAGIVSHLRHPHRGHGLFVSGTHHR